jgi:outer membrane protein assembly factor BamD (BamD/ComL family)
MLLQERSFLRIEALSLQSNARAETEAEAFLKAYPNSPYADRIRAMKR